MCASLKFGDDCGSLCRVRLLTIIILAALIGTCSAPPSILEQILETGELRVVTRDSPTSYTIGPNGPSGPEYDLVQAFADELGVTFDTEVVAANRKREGPDNIDHEAV